MSFFFVLSGDRRTSNLVIRRESQGARIIFTAKGWVCDGLNAADVS